MDGRPDASATDADIKRAGDEHDPQRAGAVLVVPDHGRLRVLFHRAVRAIRSGSRRTRELDRAPLVPASSRCTACRCRGSPRSSAGSSPNTAASRGRSRACCRRRSACRRSRPRRSRPASPDSSSSTRRSRSSTSILMRKYIRKGPDGLGMWRSTPATPLSAATADGTRTRRTRRCSTTKPCA